MGEGGIMTRTEELLFENESLRQALKEKESECFNLRLANTKLDDDLDVSHRHYNDLQVKYDNLAKSHHKALNQLQKIYNWLRLNHIHVWQCWTAFTELDKKKEERK
jgi:predicted nuclease with TOPRIM domain